MKGNYRIRLHFVGGGKMQVAYAAPSDRDAAFDALFVALSAGRKEVADIRRRIDQPAEADARRKT